jgi:outer membrane protein assembly factor BamB
MKHSYFLNHSLLALILLSACTISAQNSGSTWKQFRGPDRSGVAGDNLNTEAKDGLEATLLWKKEIGSAFSELTVEGNRLYTMESQEIDSTSGDEFCSAYHSLSGELIWRTRVDSLFFETFGNGPRSTPVIGNDMIYCLSSFGKVSALSKNDGQLIWQVDIPKTYGSQVPRWAFSTSPLLLGNILVIEAGGTDSRAFIALNVEQGKLAWANGQGVVSYCSPVLADIEGEKQILFANQDKLFSLDVKGDTLWTHKMSVVSPTAMPVVFEGNKVFISSLQSKGYCIIEIGPDGPKEISTGKNMKNDYSSSLYYDGYFYGFNVAALQCISAKTGEKRWTKRGLGKGSLIRVGDVLFALSDKGKIVMAKAQGESYEELGTFQALEGKSWTAPSYANGKIYVRNLTEMACYNIQ